MRASSFTTLAAFLAATLAQSSVPSQLSSGFEPDSITLGVGYSGFDADGGLAGGDGNNGFGDGSTLSLSEVSNQPSFCLGDASGVNTQIRYIIAMVDSTDVTNLALHYLQSDFAASGDETCINSTTTPEMSYQVPGSLGETGKRQYSFLLFQQFNDNVSGVPKTGSKFDIDSFQQSNSLKAAEAGVAMFVELSGSSSGSGSSSAIGNGSGNGGGNTNTAITTTAQQTTATTVSATAIITTQQTTKETATGKNSRTTKDSTTLATLSTSSESLPASSSITDGSAPTAFATQSGAAQSTVTSTAVVGASPSSTDSSGATGAASTAAAGSDATSVGQKSGSIYALLALIVGVMSLL